MKKNFLNLILFINLAIICNFWWQNSGTMFAIDRSNAFIALGRITGLLSVFFVLLQIILIGRTKWLEKIYGLDKLSNAHHLSAFLTFFFVIAHGFLMIIGYAGESMGFFGQIINFVKYWELLPAILSVFLFTFVFVSSLVIVFKRLKYETWYLIHVVSYLAIFLGFEHQMEIGGDFYQNTLFQAYWLLLYAFTFANLGFYRFFLPIYNFYKHQFVVTKIQNENDNTVSIYISGKNLEKFQYEAGQFAIWRFLDKKRMWQAHPFSFSSHPQDNFLRITVKNLGDYTSQLTDLQIGTKVIIDGPHGIFTTKRTKNKKLTFIAGGVGITPIYSMLSHLDQNYQSVLFNCTRTSKDIIFQNDLPKLKEKNIQVINVFSAEKNDKDEHGYMTEEKIKKYVPDYLERDFYLCGPKPMMKMVRESLTKLGVKKDKIYFEKFSLG